MREFFGGVATLGRGFAYWRSRTGLMLLGLLPAVIVGALFLAGLVALAVFLPQLTAALTPFADDWPAVWAAGIRIALGSALVAGALVLFAVSFTALTLAVGEPFYDRIWRAVEADRGVTDPGPGIGLWRALGDGVVLVLRGIGVAVLALLVGVIPVVGSVLAAVVAFTLTGWMLADELTARGLAARGITRTNRRGMLRRHRARTVGFGIATQVCFLVPLGAIFVMPAAVAGATLLAERVRADATTAPAG
ncbi:MAG: EI24 domain-containing protein [Microbacterium sp.]|uniref:EI24 domain-containing protein n=1 Tax=Microbacterium sp. TaxID=51671 RepID=UPI003A87E7C3